MDVIGVLALHDGSRGSGVHTGIHFCMRPPLALPVTSHHRPLGLFHETPIPPWLAARSLHLRLAERLAVWEKRTYTACARRALVEENDLEVKNNGMIARNERGGDQGGERPYVRMYVCCTCAAEVEGREDRSRGQGDSTCMGRAVPTVFQGKLP